MAGVDSDLIRGHIDTIILKILSEGDKYGYEICKDVEEKSGGTYELKQPTLYSCLKRLEGQGLISSYWEDSDIGGKRHYYKLTEKGEEAYKKNQEEWLRSRQIIDNLISNSHEIASSYSLVKTEEINELEKKAELAEELSEFIQEGETSVYNEESEAKAESADEENKPEYVNQTEPLANEASFIEEEIIPWGNVSLNKDEEKESEIKHEETDNEETTYSWNRFVDLSSEDQKVLVEVAPNGEETAAYVEDVESVEVEDDEIEEELDFVEEELSPAQSSIFEDEETLFVDNEVDLINQNLVDEDVDVLALLGHTVKEEIEYPTRELIENKQEELIEHNQELMIEQVQEPMLEYNEKKEEIYDEEESSPFNFNMDDFVSKSRDSYFEADEDVTPDYIAPTMKVDQTETEEKTAEEKSTFDFDAFISKHTETEDDEIYTPHYDFDQEENQTNMTTPVYHDFGANNYNNDSDDDIYVDTSGVSDDEIYLNPQENSNLDDDNLRLFSEDIFEENNIFETETTNYVVDNEPQEEETKDDFEQEIIRPENKQLMDFYKSTESYDKITPKFTEDEYKEKISSLMNYTNPKVEYNLSDVNYTFKNNTPKDFADLKAEFEKEGLVVRSHQKMVKESRNTRSYVESNKLNLINSWTSFGFVSFLITLTYLIMNNYISERPVSYNFSVKYFLFGILGLAIIPVLYTLIYFINPYKKKPARYASRIYILFAILLTVQFLLIIYCLNLQMGFYSFTQANYNHLLWIIPSLMSLYPLFDAVLHTVYFNSKNFHV